MAVYTVCECGKPYRFRNEDAGKRIKCVPAAQRTGRTLVSRPA